MRWALSAAVVLCLLVAGCGGKTGSLAGKWQGPNGTLEFTADGHVTIAAGGNFGFTWYKVEGGKMTVGHLQSGAPDETVSFKLSGDTLTIGTCLALGTMGTTEFRRAK
jgi:hypothetical protein